MIEDNNQNADSWTTVLKRLWWLRGAIAGLSILGFIDQFTNIDTWEFLRAIHTVIFGWNEIMKTLATIIGKIPSIPIPSIEFMNSIVLISSVSIPAIYGIAKTYRKDIKKAFVTFFSLSDDYSSLMSNSIFVLAIVVYMLMTPFILNYGKFNDERLEIFILFVLYFGIPWMAGFVFALFKLEGFAKGILHLIIVLSLFEVLYILEAPWINQTVIEFSCTHLPQNYPDCPIHQP